MVAGGGFGGEDARDAGLGLRDSGEVVSWFVLEELEKSGGGAGVSSSGLSLSLGGAPGSVAGSLDISLVIVAGDFSSGAGSVSSTGGHRRSRSLTNGSLYSSW